MSQLCYRRPIHIATSAGQAAVVKILLQYGANPLSETADGQTPIDFAKMYGHDEIVTILESHLHSNKK
jgi:ankyrin repeat protein